MTLPNLISIFRLLLVPAIVALMIEELYAPAFWLFLIAGVSDGVDGLLARHFGQASELGAYLDPIADKVLLVAVFLTLGVQELLPFWLVILVISRDLLIVGAVMLSWLMDKPVTINPSWTSKTNTVAQIALLCVIMGAMAFQLDLEILITVIIVIVALLTVASTIGYLMNWMAHMSGDDAINKVEK